MNHAIRTTIIALLLGLSVGVGVLVAADWDVGNHVMVNWTGDDYWYPATIVTVDGDEFFVVFDDSDREWVTADRIREERIAVGDRVFCNWQGGNLYYSGEIAGRQGNAIVVHYDDGDVEATTLACVRVEEP